MTTPLEDSISRMMLAAQVIRSVDWGELIKTLRVDIDRMTVLHPRGAAKRRRELEAALAFSEGARELVERAEALRRELRVEAPRRG